MTLTSAFTFIIFCVVYWNSPEAAVSMEKVKFYQGNCNYDRYFFSTTYHPTGICERYTCDVNGKKLSVEKCAQDFREDAKCLRLGSGNKRKQFPYCCPIYSCADYGRATMGDITYYIGDETTDISEGDYAAPTGSWTAETCYFYSVCQNGICSYPSLLKSRKTKTPIQKCELAEIEEKNAYVRVTKCPMFLESVHKNCAKLNDGDPSLPYPGCCPLYMCPPHGREQRTMEITAHVNVTEKGNCLYKGNSFPGYLSSSHPCHQLTCNAETRSVTGYECLSEEEVNWARCNTQSGLQPNRGALPHCCQELICPDMTAEDGLPDPNYYEVMVTEQKCTYRGHEFEDTLQFSSPCERWVCYASIQQVKVFRCQNIEQDLGEHCSWEAKDTGAPFPDCCNKKVCRYYYPTRYPGTKVQASPLRKPPV